MNALITLFSLALVCGFLFGPPAYLAWFYLFGGKGKTIQKKFQAAGDLRGKTIAQINAIGGSPVSLVTQGDGQVGTWGHVGYNIILVFRNGICEGVNKEINF